MHNVKHYKDSDLKKNIYNLEQFHFSRNGLADYGKRNKNIFLGKKIYHFTNKYTDFLKLKSDDLDILMNYIKKCALLDYIDEDTRFFYINLLDDMSLQIFTRKSYIKKKISSISYFITLCLILKIPLMKDVNIYLKNIESAKNKIKHLNNHLSKIVNTKKFIKDHKGKIVI